MAGWTIASVLYLASIAAILVFAVSVVVYLAVVTLNDRRHAAHRWHEYSWNENKRVIPGVTVEPRSMRARAIRVRARIRRMVGVS